MEVGERESWNSGGGGEAVVVLVGEGVGVITSSRHWGVRAVDADVGWEVVVGSVGVAGVGGGGEVGAGATDWKAWIGRASKNSWAKMKGLLEGSGGGLVSGEVEKGGGSGGGGLGCYRSEQI